MPVLENLFFFPQANFALSDCLHQSSNNSGRYPSDLYDLNFLLEKLESESSPNVKSQWKYLRCKQYLSQQAILKLLCIFSPARVSSLGLDFKTKRKKHAFCFALKTQGLSKKLSIAISNSVHHILRQSCLQLLLVHSVKIVLYPASKAIPLLSLFGQCFNTFVNLLCFLDTLCFFGFTDSLCLAALLSRRATAWGTASKLIVSIVPEQENCLFGRDDLTGVTCLYHKHKKLLLSYLFN